MECLFNRILLKERDFSLQTLHCISFDKLSLINKKSIESIRKFNPDLKIVIHSKDSDIYEEEFFTKYDLQLNQIAILERVNIHIIKYYLLYFYGGMYFDLNYICLQSLDPLFEVFEEQATNNGKELLLSRRTRNTLEDKMILSYPKNNLFLSLIKRISTLEKVCINSKKKCIILSEKNFHPLNLKTASSDLLKVKSLKEELYHSFAVHIPYSLSNTDESFYPDTAFEEILSFGTGKKEFYPEGKIDQEIFYINLYDRPQRNLFFIATWDRIFSKITRFNAVLTKGNINGCGKSHQTIVKDSLSPYTIVLEDDAIPTKQFMSNFPSILDYIKSNTSEFDLFTLATPTIVDKKKRSLICRKISDSILKISNCSSSHFIIYTPTILPFFDKFYEEIESGKTKEYNQDWYFNLEFNIRKMVSYPFLSLQYFGFVSDIVNSSREETFFACGEKQVEIVMNSSNQINMFSLIPSKYITI